MSNQPVKRVRKRTETPWLRRGVSGDLLDKRYSFWLCSEVLWRSLFNEPDDWEEIKLVIVPKATRYSVKVEVGSVSPSTKDVVFVMTPSANVTLDELAKALIPYAEQEINVECWWR